MIVSPSTKQRRTREEVPRRCCRHGEVERPRTDRTGQRRGQADEDDDKGFRNQPHARSARRKVRVRPQAQDAGRAPRRLPAVPDANAHVRQLRTGTEGDDPQCPPTSDMEGSSGAYHRARPAGANLSQAQRGVERGRFRGETMDPVRREEDRGEYYATEEYDPGRCEARTALHVRMDPQPVRKGRADGGDTESRARLRTKGGRDDLRPIGVGAHGG